MTQIDHLMQAGGIVQELQKQDSNNDGIKEDVLVDIGAFRFYGPTDASLRDYKTLGAEIEQIKEFWKLYAVDVTIDEGKDFEKDFEHTKKITVKGQTYDILKIYPVHFANGPLHHYKLYIRTRQK